MLVLYVLSINHFINSQMCQISMCQGDGLLFITTHQGGESKEADENSQTFDHQSVHLASTSLSFDCSERAEVPIKMWPLHGLISSLRIHIPHSS